MLMAMICAFFLKVHLMVDAKTKVHSHLEMQCRADSSSQLNGRQWNFSGASWDWLSSKTIDDIKDKDKLRDRQGAVYKIKWTVRPLILARLANERLEMVISTITFAEHQLQTNHGINWVSAKCITKSMDYF